MALTQWPQVVQAFQQIQTRFRHALYPDVCRYCLKQPLESPLQLCTRCEGILMLRPPKHLFRHQQQPVYAAFHFSPEMRQLVYQYKFHGKPHSAETLSKYLYHFWQSHPLYTQWQARHQCPWVISLPSRDKTGENASLSIPNHLQPIAEAFAHLCGYLYEPNALQWTRQTLPQHHVKGRHARWKNIQGALSCQPDFARRMTFSPAPVIIIDDLVTTGATMAEAIGTVKKALTYRDACPEIVGLSLSHVQLGSSKRFLQLGPTPSHFSEI